jgi:hypothetical protein
MPNDIARPVSTKSRPNISATPIKPEKPVSCNSLLEEMRRSMVAEAAYYIAESRRFESGHEVQDWLLAEKQIDDALSAPPA